VDVDDLYVEVSTYLQETDVNIDGDRLYSNYQRVTAIMIRLQEIKNEIAYLELHGQAGSDLKKFRTTILEDTIRTFEKVANYESRKISARQIEVQLDKDR
jgi:hypothetical protein